MAKRASGVLLHIGSLPSGYGIGDFGSEAYKFADFLQRANQSYWQVLPLTPPAPGSGFSPYNPCSAFAGNTLFISPDLLYQAGLLNRSDIYPKPNLPMKEIDYHWVISCKTKLLNLAFKRFRSARKDHDYEDFCYTNRGWLDSFATFAALRRHLRSGPWSRWPPKLRDRENKTLARAKLELKDEIDREKFLQHLFFTQWSSLKAYCGERSIKLIGDIPFYVAYDSADVWAYPQFFKLTRTKKPRFVGGVPPDFFSRTGQLWGNPVYDWPALRATGYSWWMERIQHNLAMFDVARLDHFRGFVAYWQVHAGHKTARHGTWVRGPGQALFDRLFGRFPSKPIIAEDLGHITEAVRRLIDKLQIPSMRVLQFGFDGDPDTNPHSPKNHTPNCVAYTGTHDTNTIRGWLENEVGPAQRQRIVATLGRKIVSSQIHWELIELAISSAADLVIIPMQDVLGLSQNTRMNRPGTMHGNWNWRLRPGQISTATIKKLRDITEACGRSPDCYCAS